MFQPDNYDSWSRFAAMILPLPNKLMTTTVTFYKRRCSLSVEQCVKLLLLQTDNFVLHLTGKNTLTFAVMQSQEMPCVQWVERIRLTFIHWVNRLLTSQSQIFLYFQTCSFQTQPISAQARSLDVIYQTSLSSLWRLYKTFFYSLIRNMCTPCVVLYSDLHKIGETHLQLQPIIKTCKSETGNISLAYWLNICCENVDIFILTSWLHMLWL